MPNSSRHTDQARGLRPVPIGDMRVNPAAQREFRQRWADHLLSIFDIDKLGTPTVNLRDGHYYIVDGQHSVDALKRWLGDGWEDQKLQCWTYEGLTEQEEAEMFLSLNHRLHVDAYDGFMAAITADRPLEVDVLHTVRTQGLAVSNGGGAGTLACVATLVKVYKRSDAETLGMALRIVRDAFGDAGLERDVVDGIGHLCQRYNGVLDEAHAIAQLRKVNGGVTGLLNQSYVLRKQTGNTKAHCLAAVAVEAINRGRGGQKLPSWWKT